MGRMKNGQYRWALPTVAPKRKLDTDTDTTHTLPAVETFLVVESPKKLKYTDPSGQKTKEQVNIDI